MATPTFDRNSASWITDHEGVVREIGQDEPHFDGLRYVKNLVPDAAINDMSDAAWVKGTDVTASDADTIVYGGGGSSGASRVYVIVVASGSSKSRSMRASLELKADSSVPLRIRSISSGSMQEISVTTAWQRFATVVTAEDGSNNLVCEILGGDGDNSSFTLDVRNQQTEDVSGQANQAPSVFVSDYAYYDYLNGSTVNGFGVVTEATGAQITGQSGLYMQPTRTNEIEYSYDLTQAEWAKAGATNALDEAGISANLLHASTIGDDDAGALEYIQNSTTVADDSAVHSACIYLKKDTDQTRFPAIFIQYTGGTPLNYAINVNTQTGAYDDTPGAYATPNHTSVTSAGLWWRVEISGANNSSGNTTANTRIYPAFGTALGTASVAATGSCIVGHAQFVENSAIPGSPIVTEGAATQQLTETLTYPIPDFSDTAGAAEAVVKMDHDYDQDDLSGASIMAVTTTSTAGLFYYGATDGQIGAWDGTASSITIVNWSVEDVLRLRARWNTTGNVRAISTTENGGSLLSDTDSNYDGSFSSDGTLRINSGTRPCHMQSVKIWDIDKGAAWLVEV